MEPTENNKAFPVVAVFIVLIVLAAIAAYFVFKKPFQKSALEQQQMVADIIKTGKIEDCAKAKGIVIDGNDYEKVCRNNILNVQAEQNLDESSCDKLTDEGNIIDCKMEILTVKIARGDGLSLCDNPSILKIKSWCFDKYWEQSAKRKIDVNLCKKISATVVRDNCQMDVLIANVTKDQTAFSCNNFVSAIQQADCKKYKSATEKKQCFSILTLSIQQACLLKFDDL